MKEIIATEKFKRSFRKFVKRNAQLEQKMALLDLVGKVYSKIHSS